MKICSGNKYVKHDEIIYDDMDCPFCDYMEETKQEIKDLQIELEIAKKDIEKLEEAQ